MEQYEQLCLFDMGCPQMPKSYVGKELTNGGFTIYTPRQWTAEEIDWCLDLRNKGYSIQEIADSVCRDKASVSLKLKRLTKKNDTYNLEHLKEKYNLNDEFYEVIKPEKVLDVYSGKKHYWKSKCNCVSNDIDTEIEADYHMDSLKFLCQEFLKGNKYDLIDLDPYGSAYDCFDLAVKMAKKGLIITYGEMGHKRWKRLDYVGSIYGITDIKDFNIQALIAKTQDIARHNKKNLEVWRVCEWRNITRVYYIIQELKITEQWEKKDE